MRGPGRTYWADDGTNVSDDTPSDGGDESSASTAPSTILACAHQMTPHTHESQNDEREKSQVRNFCSVLCVREILWQHSENACERQRRCFTTSYLSVIPPSRVYVCRCTHGDAHEHMSLLKTVRTHSFSGAVCSQATELRALSKSTCTRERIYSGSGRL